MLTAGESGLEVWTSGLVRRAAVLFLGLVILAVSVAGCASTNRADRDLDRLRDIPLYNFNERELDTYLAWLDGQPLTSTQRVAHLARKNLGQPYRLYLLGEHPFELQDPDPMYCLFASDCVTFVEHTWSAALSNNWRTFFQTLQSIRYRDGEVGMLTRNHFTSADWNINNAWLFADVTAEVGGNAVQPMRVRVDRAGFFKQFGLGEGLPVEIFHGTFIPRAGIEGVLGSLQDGDVLQIVKGTETWQYVSHLGLILHDKAGRVTMIHSASPAVREEPLMGYLDRYPSILGLKFLRFSGCRDYQSPQRRGGMKNVGDRRGDAEAAYNQQ